MEPTLKYNDRLFIDKLTYRFAEPKRGDVVAFKPNNRLQKKDFPKEYSYLRRIIGLPGKTVEVNSGRVYINGQLFQEYYINVPTSYEYGPLQIPDNSYLVLGNNPNYNKKLPFGGLVLRNEIIGRVSFRF